VRIVEKGIQHGRQLEHILAKAAVVEIDGLQAPAIVEQIVGNEIRMDHAEAVVGLAEGSKIGASLIPGGEQQGALFARQCGKLPEASPDRIGSEQPGFVPTMSLEVIGQANSGASIVHASRELSQPIMKCSIGGRIAL